MLTETHRKPSQLFPTGLVQRTDTVFYSRPEPTEDHRARPMSFIRPEILAAAQKHQRQLITGAIALLGAWLLWLGLSGATPVFTAIGGLILAVTLTLTIAERQRARDERFGWQCLFVQSVELALCRDRCGDRGEDRGEDLGLGGASVVVVASASSPGSTAEVASSSSPPPQAAAIRASTNRGRSRRRRRMPRIVARARWLVGTQRVADVATVRAA